MTKQIWTIKGQNYTHEQILEMKRQGLDPRKDTIELKFLRAEKPVQEPVEVKEPQLQETPIEENKEIEITEAVEEVKKEKTEEDSEAENLVADLFKQYENKFGKPVPNRYKSDEKWIKKTLTV